MTLSAGNGSDPSAVGAVGGPLGSIGDSVGGPLGSIGDSVGGPLGSVGDRVDGPAPWQATFLQRVTAVADVSGVPPSYVQVLAWLVVCDPADQSVDQMQAALGLSSGAISMATSSLIRMGLVQRMAQLGQRRQFYRFRPGGWEQMLRLRIEASSQMRAIAEDALAEAPDPPARLAEMRNIYAWFETRMVDLLAEQPWSHGD